VVKPIVDGLERDLTEQARLFRVDRATPVAMELARRYDLSLLPAVLVFDGSGQLAYAEQGSVTREEVVAVVEEVGSDAGSYACPVSPTLPCEEP
jgi:hypothetical protein